MSYKLKFNNNLCALCDLEPLWYILKVRSSAKEGYSENHSTFAITNHRTVKHITFPKNFLLTSRSFESIPKLQDF